jgi:hypothetical protein
VTGKGVRIKAGAARSYYIGLETSMPAVPGYKPPLKALCVVPQGMEEGTELLIEGREFGLVTGRAAIERKPSLDRRPRLFVPTEMREGGGKTKMRHR